MICQPGLCCVCEKSIADGGRPTDQYTQVTVKWSNGSKMDIGVCKGCASSHAWNTPEAKVGITKAHQDYWTKMGGTFDHEVVIDG